MGTGAPRDRRLTNQPIPGCSVMSSSYAKADGWLDGLGGGVEGLTLALRSLCSCVWGGVCVCTRAR